MINLILPLFNYTNGAFSMVVVFNLVILGLVGVVFLLLMNTDKKKKGNG